MLLGMCPAFSCLCNLYPKVVPNSKVSSEMISIVAPGQIFVWHYDEINQLMAMTVSSDSQVFMVSIDLKLIGSLCRTKMPFEWSVECQRHTQMCEQKFSIKWLYRATTPQAVFLWNTNPVSSQNYTTLQVIYFFKVSVASTVFHNL